MPFRKNLKWGLGDSHTYTPEVPTAFDPQSDFLFRESPNEEIRHGFSSRVESIFNYGNLYNRANPEDRNGLGIYDQTTRPAGGMAQDMRTDLVDKIDTGSFSKSKITKMHHISNINFPNDGHMIVAETFNGEKFSISRINQTDKFELITNDDFDFMELTKGHIYKHSVRNLAENEEYSIRTLFQSFMENHGKGHITYDGAMSESENFADRIMNDLETALVAHQEVMDLF